MSNDTHSSASIIATATDTAGLKPDAPPPELEMIRRTIREYTNVPMYVPNTTCNPRSPIKLRSNRGEYWPETSVRVTIVREKTVAMTVIRLPEIAVSTELAPDAPPEITVGRLSRVPCKMWSNGWVTSDKRKPADVRIAGTNQKLELNRSQKEPRRLPEAILLSFATPGVLPYFPKSNP